MKWLLIILMALVGIEMVNALTLTNACGVLSTLGETYQLTSNVNSTRYCFNITSNGIVLDCDGYMINYSANATGTAVGYGVITGNHDIVIENCNFYEQLSTGNAKHSIFIKASTNVTIFNNTFYNKGAGSYGIALQVNATANARLSLINISNNNFYGTTTNFGINSTMINDATIAYNNFTMTVANQRGISIANLNHSIIKYNTCNNTNSGICYNLVNMNNSIFDYNNATVFGSGSSLTITGTNYNITNNYLLGTQNSVGGRNVNIYNNFMNMSGTGLSFAGTQLASSDVYSNTVYGGSFYAVAFGSSDRVHFYNNFVKNRDGTGNSLNMNGINNLIENNTFEINPAGAANVIYFQADIQNNNTFINNRLVTNGANTPAIRFYGYGINATTMINTVVNDTLGQQVVVIRTAYTIANQNVTLINLTYINGSRADVFTTAGFIGVGLNVNVGWYQRVRTDYWNGTRLNNSNITIYDNKEGKYPMALNITNDNGLSDYTPLLEYTRNGSQAIGNKTYYYYNFSAQNLGVTQNITLIPQFNQDVVFPFTDGINCNINCSQNYTIVYPYENCDVINTFDNGKAFINSQVKFRQFVINQYENNMCTLYDYVGLTSR